MGEDEQVLKDLLLQFVEKSGKKQLFDEQRVLTLWKEKMPDNIRNGTKCLSIQNGVLRLKVTNASMRFYLMTRKSEMIDTMNSWTGLPVVKDIILS